MKWQGLDRIRQRFVKIHVLSEAVRIQKVIARPSRSDGSQRRGIEFKRHFVSRSDDDKPVVCSVQQRQYVSVCCEVAGVVGIGTGRD